MSGVVYIDERVKYVGMTKFRNLTSKKLRDLPDDELWVVQDSGGTPLVVVVPYNFYLTLQEKAGLKP